jgi:dimethylargininase
MNFNHAIVRPPSTSFDQGITSSDLGAPELVLALEQHRAYCAALESCGVSVISLEPDPRFPDSTFVEDTAVLTPCCAVLANPGAASRRGEVTGIEPEISQYFERIYSIESPGTLDGGDVCQVDNHFFIGISGRTNASGAQQLASILIRDGYTSSFVSLRGKAGLLHLKSGIAYLGEGRLVMVEELVGAARFTPYEITFVDQEESYAANCVRINDTVLVPAGYPKLTAQLSKLGYQIMLIEVSEFEKMDGGLSCLSLRF